MKIPPLNLEEAAKELGASLYGRTGGPLTGVAVDSRQVEPGDLFIAVKGAKVDGHRFLRDVFARGAGAALVRGDWNRFASPSDVTGSLIVLPDGQDTTEALGRLGQWRFRRARADRKPIPVVGVTGSAGKTSTKEMVATVLEVRYPTLKNEGNLNTEFGLPMTMLRTEPDHRAAVFEMGMRGLGEISQLCRLASPSIGVVTNVGLAHLELLGSIENIARAKGELPEALPPEGTAVLSSDDPWVRGMSQHTRARAVFFGLDPVWEPSFTAIDLRSLGDQGQVFTLIMPEGAAPVRLPALGRHQILNALAASAAAWALGFRLDEIVQGLEALRPSQARARIVRAGGATLIDDTYNASPASTRAALKVLADLGPGRRVAVLGNMFELGAEAEEGHRQVGREAAACGVDLLVTVGELARWIAGEAVRAGLSPEGVLSFDDKSGVSAALKERVRPGDLVLFKGSRGMKMEELLAALESYLGKKE